MFQWMGSRMVGFRSRLMKKFKKLPVEKNYVKIQKCMSAFGNAFLNASFTSRKYVSNESHIFFKI